MRRQEACTYRCPASGEPLALEVDEAHGDLVLSGALVSSGGRCYPIRNGVPHLVYPTELPDSDAQMLAWYEQEADTYDKYLPLTFSTFGVDETEARNAMIDGLSLVTDSKVLETSCGTGRSSVLIAERLGAAGMLYLQDLTPGVLGKAVKRLQGAAPGVAFSLATGYYLPFPDNYFDAAYHFGGLNTFGDVKRAFSEMARVTRPGGKVVIGDESMPPWLRDTEFGRILLNSNPFYKYDLPLQQMPVEARNVIVRWIIGGVFYTIEFSVGVGEPTADFDFEIPGRRGGTHRTRLYGQLEGVTAEAKELALQAHIKSGKSMHRWLSDTIIRAAREELDRRQKDP